MGTEKTPDNKGPSVAIPAANADALDAYWAEIARYAGAIDVTLHHEEGRIMLAKVGRQLDIKLPIRAGKLIAALKKLTGGYGDDPVKIGPYKLLLQDYVLLDERGQGTRLTEKEAAILLHLYHQQGKPISRQALLDAVWSYAAGVETHTLETHIYRLRQKIEEDPARPQILMTLEDGYILKS